MDPERASQLWNTTWFFLILCFFGVFLKTCFIVSFVWLLFLFACSTFFFVSLLLEKEKLIFENAWVIRHEKNVWKVRNHHFVKILFLSFQCWGFAPSFGIHRAACSSFLPPLSVNCLSHEWFYGKSIGLENTRIFSVWKDIRFDKIYENVNNMAIRMKARNSCFTEHQKS